MVKTRRSRKSRKKVGGSISEKQLLIELQVRLESLFKKHKPVEVLVFPFRKMYLSVVFAYDGDTIRSLDILISESKPNQDLLTKFGDPELPNELSDLRKKSCYLGSELHENTSKPWGEYVYENTTSPKKIDIRGDYGFSLECSSYQGTGFTAFLFLVYFFTLKVQARLLKRTDYIITDSDDAMMYYSKTKTKKSITQYVVETLKIRDIAVIMNTPLLYYERYGFVYPEKEEFFTNYLKEGEAYVREGAQLKSKGTISIYYLDLAKKTIDGLLDEAEKMTLKV